MVRVLALVLVLLSLVPSSAAAQTPGCEFVLGFGRLRELVGAEKVGGCLEPEHHNPANGDALQRTTGGLMVWRKADNWTAFTDGHRTWINGPRGLQQRLNTERFDWEGRPPAGGRGGPVARPPVKQLDCASGDIFVEREAKRDPNGRGILVGGRVTNRCASAQTIEIDAVLRAGQGGTSDPPQMEAPTLHLSGVAPGQTRDFQLRIPMNGEPSKVTVTAFPVPAGDDFLTCVPVHAGGACIEIDPWLASVVEVLLQTDEGTQMLRRAAGQVLVGRGRLPRGYEGVFLAEPKVILLASALDASTRRVRATTLAHELKHAVDFLDGRISYKPETMSPEDCFRSERDAFHTQARIWSRLWHNQLPTTGDFRYRVLNAITWADQSNAPLLDQVVNDTYKPICEPIDEEDVEEELGD